MVTPHHCLIIHSFLHDQPHIYSFQFLPLRQTVAATSPITLSLGNTPTPPYFSHTTTSNPQQFLKGFQGASRLELG
ncbi:hypothetical protein RchiOBHm_Chr2g0116201 [Rosa chinensis]|uniref:Uncharacterized protein n=1 Tax=Rosa chinensis TaxID=74649 RepID=A0A2P6RR64_ROSCH|nr:hypothetical protein RchiOBHm_Chr2g0116201 [Rosa chinensis]